MNMWSFYQNGTLVVLESLVLSEGCALRVRMINRHGNHKPNVGNIDKQGKAKDGDHIRGYCQFVRIRN